MDWTRRRNHLHRVRHVHNLLKGRNGKPDQRENARFPLLAAFYLVAVSELGDETQIAFIVLAAENLWASVLIGVMLAFIILVSVAVVFGAKVLARLPRKWLKIGTASVFMILDVVSIASVLLNIQLI